MTLDEAGPDITQLTAASENGAGPGTAEARRRHRAQGKRARAGRRRWPIVTTSLVVLLAVIIGGGYIAWTVSQGQYFFTTNSKGEVVIYRGVNQRIAGVSLFRFYSRTGISLAQVPSNYQQPIRDGNAVGNLAYVHRTTADIRKAVSQCQQQYARLEQWVTAQHNYQRALAQAKARKKPARGIPGPGPQPSVNPGCAPAAAFGIPASALSPAVTGHS
jgi:hypothetical protein